MEVVKFQAFVDADRLIRLPDGMAIPGGPVEVTVRAVAPPQVDESDPMASTREWLLGLAREAETITEPLPPDLAENHDHYAHGKPRE